MEESAPRMTEEQELAEKLADGEPPRPPREFFNPAEVAGQSPPQPCLPTSVDFAQWQILANGRYRPGARTRESLPSGAYRVDVDQFGPFLESITILSDSLIELPEPAHIRVLTGIRKFWESRGRYEKHGLLYKRGILLWGPPGGGKTVTVQLLMQELCDQHDGMVLLADNPELTVSAIRFIRAIEKERPLIVVFEDVDEVVQRHGEHALLACLDGEHHTGNVVCIATTNYPERLGARIVNRPSRFDERIKIGMPTPETRLAYLQKTANLDAATLRSWVKDTDGLSIAHLRELVVAVICLDQPYATVIERLRAMEIQPKPEDGYRLRLHGFANSASAAGDAKRAEEILRFL